MVDAMVARGANFAPLEASEDVLRFEELQTRIACTPLGIGVLSMDPIAEKAKLTEWVYNFIADMRRLSADQRGDVTNVWNQIKARTAQNYHVIVPDWLKVSLLESYSRDLPKNETEIDDDEDFPMDVTADKKCNFAPLDDPEENSRFEQMRCVIQDPFGPIDPQGVEAERRKLTEWVYDFILHMGKLPKSMREHPVEVAMQIKQHASQYGVTVPDHLRTNLIASYVTARELLRLDPNDDNYMDLAPRGRRVFAPLENHDDALRFERIKFNIVSPNPTMPSVPANEAAKEKLLEWLYNFIADMRREFGDYVDRPSVTARLERHAAKHRIVLSTALKLSILSSYSNTQR